MIAVPYLILFAISMALHLLSFKKPKFRKAAYITGALCGVYVVFMLCLWLGEGPGAGSASYRVRVNGMNFLGQVPILPIVIFAFILIPLFAYAPVFVAMLLRSFFDRRHYKDIPVAASIIGVLAAFVISVIPLVQISHELQYYDNFGKYLAEEFVQFSFLGLLLAVCWLVIVRFILEMAMSLFRKIRKARK